MHLQMPQAVERDSYKMDGESDNGTLKFPDSIAFDDDTCDIKVV